MRRFSGRQPPGLFPYSALLGSTLDTSFRHFTEAFGAFDLPRSSSTWAVVCAGWFCSSRNATRCVPFDRRLVGVGMPGVMLDSLVQTVQRPVEAPQVQILAGCGCACRCATTGARFVGAETVVVPQFSSKVVDVVVGEGRGGEERGVVCVWGGGGRGGGRSGEVWCGVVWCGVWFVVVVVVLTVCLCDVSVHAT